MKLLTDNLAPKLLPLLAAALLAAPVACGQADSPAGTTPLTATPAPTTASAEPTTPSPTPMAMLPTQTPAPRPTPTITPPTAVPSALASRVYSTLVEITEQYSPRESATDQELEAALHLRDRLDELGYDTSVQSFTVNLLTAGVELHSTTGDSSNSPRAIPISMSIHGSATGALAYAGRALEGDIPDGELENRVALIERGRITFEEKVDRVAEAGAVGAIIFNDREGLFRGTFRRESRIPAVAISQADGNRILELIEQGGLEAAVQIGDAESPSRNVIADKPGTTGDGRTVIIGAHYDTVADTEGASDNGSGIATVLTLAEHMADRNYPFDVRIILFGSEEVGLLGSQHYVANMSDDEIGDTIAMLNFDAFGSGATLQASGDPDLVAEASLTLTELGLELGRFSEEAWASLGGGERPWSIPTGRHSSVPPNLRRSLPHQLPRRRDRAYQPAPARNRHRDWHPPAGLAGGGESIRAYTARSAYTGARCFDASRISTPTGSIKSFESPLCDCQ